VSPRLYRIIPESWPILPVTQSPFLIRSPRRSFLRLQNEAGILEDEAVGAGQAIVGLPSAIADSVTVAPTADEQKTLGVPANPSLAQKAALALYRNLGEPIANAAQFYGTLVKHNHHS